MTESHLIGAEVERLLRGLLDAKDREIAELRQIVHEAGCARDEAGFLGSAAECIEYLAAERDAALAQVAAREDDVALLRRARALLQPALERAYGCLWRETGDAGLFVFRARKLLLSILDREAQKRGIAWALEQFGEPNPEEAHDAIGPGPARAQALHGRKGNDKREKRNE